MSGKIQEPVNPVKPVNPNTLRTRLRRARMTAAERSAENVKYATKRRNDLILAIAPDLRCATCGLEVASASELQVDHVNGRTWLLDMLGPSQRYARYWREYKRGVPMRALCGSCNASDGAHRRYDRPRGRNGYVSRRRRR